MTDEARFQSVHLRVADLLAQAGSVYTPRRRSLVDRMLSTDLPLTATELAGPPSDQPLGTVYRNLLLLRRSEAIVRIGHGRHVEDRYQLADRLCGVSCHLRCRICNEITVLPLVGDLQRAVLRFVDAAGAATAFSISEPRIELVGTCRGCAVMLESPA